MSTSLAGLLSTSLSRRRGELLIAASAVSVTHTGDTTETALATVALPAGLMGPNDALVVETVWTYTGSTNLKTLKGYLGGLAGAVFLTTNRSSASEIGAQLAHVIQNRNARNSQISFSPGTTSAWGVATSAHLTSAIDMAAAQNLIITGKLASAGELIRLERYLVKLLRA